MTTPKDGDARKCPKCGKTAKFKNRTRVPGSGVGMVGPGGALPEPEYAAAWKCENFECLYFERG
jgi:hypothetical protein